MSVKHATVTKLALSVFALIFVSFIVRGFGQFIVGPRTAMLVAGPIALVAAGVLLFVVAVWILAWIGVTSIEQGEDE